MGITVAIEANNTFDAEEKILEMADDIRERRALVADGCTCDLRQPKAARRCHGPFVFCDARLRRLPGGSVSLADVAAPLSRLATS